VLDEIAEAHSLDASANPIELCYFLSAQRALMRG
jgi:hypothetical protein